MSKPFVCIWCDEVFTSGASLDNHYEAFHTHVEPVATPPDQPEDVALRDAIRKACMVNIRGVNKLVCSISQKQTDAIMQLFHEQQAQAVQAGRHAEFDMWFGRYLMQPPTGDFTVTITRQALIQRQKDFYYSSELQATQPPAADTTKQGEGESDD